VTVHNGAYVASRAAIGKIEVFSNAGGFELGARAFKGTPDQATRSLFGI
jgi:hypothetical protein